MSLVTQLSVFYVYGFLTVIPLECSRFSCLQHFLVCKPKIRIVNTGENFHLAFVKVQNQSYSIKQAQDLSLQQSYPDPTWECDQRN